MKDIYKVLQQTEADIAQVRTQIKNLQIVSPLFCNVSNWRDAYECLRHKEDELARVRHEIESLQIVAPLLAEEVPFDKRTRLRPQYRARGPASQRRLEQTACILRPLVGSRNFGEF